MLQRSIVVLRILMIQLIVVALCLVGVYYTVMAPPLHLYFQVLPPAGPSTVYVPGSGFSGFWYHLGALQSVPNLHDFDYYCYSSGCLSTVLALLNTSIDHVASVAFEIQEAWDNGTIHRYEMTEQFVHRLIVEPLMVLAQPPPPPPSPVQHNVHENQTAGTTLLTPPPPEESDLAVPLPLTSSSATTSTTTRTTQLTEPVASDASAHNSSFMDHQSPTNNNNIWNRLHILVTSVQEGVVVRKPRNLTELKEHLIQSAWIPFVTGWGVAEDSYTGKLHMDGGFSRVLHPPCEHSLGVPLTWELTWHTLNPGLNRHLVWKFWEYGRGNNHSLIMMQQQGEEKQGTKRNYVNNHGISGPSPIQHELNSLGEVQVGER